MSTNAQDAMGHLDRALTVAKQGDFFTARDYWTDACDALSAAKRANEHKVASEYSEALQQATKFLDDHGQAMADAFAQEARTSPACCPASKQAQQRRERA